MSWVPPPPRGLPTSRSQTSRASIRTSRTMSWAAPATCGASCAQLHPVFYGSFDWHSCVHMHWLLARLRRLFPALPQRDAIGHAFDLHFTRDAIAVEVAYLARPEARSFERTYGWAWLLKLAEELIDLRERRRPLVRGACAACGIDRRTLSRLPAACAIPVALRPAHEQRVRPRVCARLCPRRGRTGVGGALRRQGARLVRRRSRCTRGMGAFGRGFSVAGVDRGGIDATDRRPGRIRHVACGVSARIRSTRTCDALHAGGGERSQRRRTSFTSTASTCRVPGAFAASRPRWPTPIPARRSPPRRHERILRRDSRDSTAAKYVGAHWLATFATLALAGGGNVDC